MTDPAPKKASLNTRNKHIDAVNKPFVKIFNKVKKNFKPNVRKVATDDWRNIDAQICNIVALTGAIVVTLVILRSLYLMYIKSEET